MTFTAADGLYQEHAAFLFRLCYRMTGVAADADDLVQETFARALTANPNTEGESLRPWLVRVATRLSIDHLRKRKRSPYIGPWLPSPLHPEGAGGPPDYVPSEAANPEQRYGDAESLSYAFLETLETMLPTQRAVFLFRDALGYSVEETASLLGLSEANVKTTHHRARTKMGVYDKATADAPLASRREAVREALARLFTAALSGDTQALEALLREDVTSLSDGAGEYHAALRPIRGRDHVARLIVGLARKNSDAAVRYYEANGFPGFLSQHPRPLGGETGGRAPLSFMTCDVDEHGYISKLYIVVASRKLFHVRFALSTGLP